MYENAEWDFSYLLFSEMVLLLNTGSCALYIFKSLYQLSGQPAFFIWFIISKALCVLNCFSLLQNDGFNNSTLNKLQFVLYLVRCVLDLADSRQMISIDGDHVADVQLHSPVFKVNHACYLSTNTCYLERLVLYMRSLHLISSALQLAKLHMKTGTLPPSQVMKNSKLIMMNQCLHICVV